MPQHQGLSVFIIDDNEMTRSLLRAIIQASTDRSTVEQSLRNGAKA
jgi:hypothetical protein